MFLFVIQAHELVCYAPTIRKRIRVEMSVQLILAAIGFLVGFFWGFRSPANYCHLGTEGAKAFGNRLSSGLINGVIVGAIVGLLSFFALG